MDNKNKEYLFMDFVCVRVCAVCPAVLSRCKGQGDSESAGRSTQLYRVI